MFKCRETFSKRMAQDGLIPHHRIVRLVDVLLAIVVDHGLRVESKEEANVVRERVSKLGISCEVVHCECKDGRPDSGHLHVAAREMRVFPSSIALACKSQQDSTL